MRITSNIRLLKGVKKGDLLSPMLFNMAVDPLLVLGMSVTSLAFADDLV